LNLAVTAFNGVYLFEPETADAIARLTGGWRHLTDLFSFADPYIILQKYKKNFYFTKGPSLC